MKSFIYTISVILLFQMAIFGQDKDVCVEIKAVDKIGVGETLKVTADLKVDFLTAPQKLHWKTSNGKTLTTDDFTAQFATTKEDAGKTIKISLEFEGLPDNCLKVYEKNIEVDEPVQNLIGSPRKIDEYSNKISWNEEKKRLLKLFDLLRKDESVRSYLIIHTNKTNSKEIIQRQQKIINFVKKEKINTDLVKIILHKSKLEITEYFVVPKDAEKPN